MIQSSTGDRRGLSPAQQAFAVRVFSLQVSSDRVETYIKIYKMRTLIVFTALLRDKLLRIVFCHFHQTELMIIGGFRWRQRDSQ